MESVATPDGYGRQEMHWFKVTFADGTGHCFITAGEAERITPLTTSWIERALLNLAVIRGWPWLKSRIGRTPGLMLHHGDAD